jgi:hypothetical protein
MLKLVIILSAMVLAAGCGGSKSNEQSGEDVSLSATAPSATEIASATRTLIPTATLPPVSGDRLRIPAIGVDAPLTFKAVSPSGNLPDPDGPDDALVYDFSENFPDLGGLPTAGNTVVYGQPDSGSQPCKGGTVPPPCEAVFWDLTRLNAGDTLVLDWAGQRFSYAVVSICKVAVTTILDEIYKAKDAPTLTLLTHGGDFDFDKLRYPDLVFVRAEAKLGTIDASCPTGSSVAPSPTPGPTPTPHPPAEVSITSLPDGVRIGERLHIEAKSISGAQCHLKIYSRDGIAEYGATRDVEDPSGLLAVDWLIEDKIEPGDKRFEIDCGGEPVSRDLQIAQ